MTRVVGISPPNQAAPGFEEPFEMLHACHERVERMLDLLARMRSHMRANGADDQVRQAARDVMRYFDMAAPHHHRDEELHVFPVLLGLGNAQLVQLVARLQQDHLKMESGWAAVRSLLEEVECGARSRFNEADDAILDSFAGVYLDHLQAEESAAFPHASAAIDPQRIESMSAEMMARRGVR